MNFKYFNKNKNGKNTVNTFVYKTVYKINYILVNFIFQSYSKSDLIYTLIICIKAKFGICNKNKFTTTMIMRLFLLIFILFFYKQAYSYTLKDIQDLT